nr:alpha/beta hydrolase [uncultured Duganella sp.]
MNKKIEHVVRERLRTDAPVAWALAGEAWLESQLRAFYPDASDLRGALAVLAEDLSQAGLAIDPQAMAKLARAGGLDLTVEQFITQVEHLVALAEVDRRSHRGQLAGTDADKAYAEIRVYFATDREPLAGSDTQRIKFGAGRAPQGALQHGVCDVTVPASHRLANLESPSWWRFEFRPDPTRHIVLQNVMVMDEDPFFASIQTAVNESPRHDAFVFVHGFNVSFEDAARRAAQMAFDLEFQGAPIIYSWPSQAALSDYTVDENNVIWTGPHLERFLEALAARSGAARIHVIAHSMGNRAVCDALAGLSRSAWAGRTVLRHLVLTAPDIDADTFKELAKRFRATAGSVTLYVSKNDRAIKLSQGIHGEPRAGGGVVVVPGVETVDASTVDTDFLGHSFFSAARTVLSDIYSLLRDDKRAGERFGLQVQKLSGETYFVFRR